MKHEAQAETVRRVEGDPDHKSGQPEHGPICPDHCLGCQSYGGGYFAESVRNASDIERAIISAGRKPGGALIVFPDSLPVAHNALIIRLAEQRRLPAVYPFRVFAANGGLMSYGLDLAEIYRQAAIYVDEILRGSKPAELLVEAPNKFELVINLKARRRSASKCRQHCSPAPTR